jgi:cob(I)alamin adenosyltransferase
LGKLKKAFVQVYTGNGKGKSTAAIGQAVRAAGHGFKSYILQIMKDFPYGEVNSLNRLNDLIEVKKVCGDDWVFANQLPPHEEKAKAKKALDDAKDKMLSGKYDLIILDEALVAIYFKLFDESEITDFITARPN